MITKEIFLEGYNIISEILVFNNEWVKDKNLFFSNIPKLTSYAYVKTSFNNNRIIIVRSCKDNIIICFNEDINLITVYGLDYLRQITVESVLDTIFNVLINKR